MKENWEKLIGKKILLKKRTPTWHISDDSTNIVETTVLDVSGKYVNFKWQSGIETWEIPEDAQIFNYTEILKVLNDKTPRKIKIMIGAFEDNIAQHFSHTIEIKVWDDITLKELVASCERKIKQIEIW